MGNQQQISQQWLTKSKPEKIEDVYDLNKKESCITARGRVIITQHKFLGFERAVKIIQKNLIADPDDFKKSIEILYNLEHPNVIKLFESYEDDKNIYLVMELCTGGQLFEKLTEQNNFTEKESKNILKQIMQAIHYCHIHGLCHRDIKPEHLLFLDKNPNSQIKLIGFDDSVYFNDKQYKTLFGKTQLKQKIGTPYYIAPEVLESKYDELCDIWSAGVILYILLAGKPPFNGTNEGDVLKAVKSGIYTLDIPELNGISNDCKDLLSKMLTKHNQRLNAELVLKHTWLI